MILPKVCSLYGEEAAVAPGHVELGQCPKAIFLCMLRPSRRGSLHDKVNSAA
jgi:hypothetical protein